MIDGRFKLILPAGAKSDQPFATIPNMPELYDLKTDPLEKQNRAAEKPDVVERLKALQSSFWKFD